MFFKMKPTPKDVPITALSSLTLTISGMRSTIVYELLCQGEQTTLSYYQVIYRNHQEERMLINSAACSTQSILQLLNDCHLSTWDGFQGDNPPGVLDGEMFSLKAHVNGSTFLRAEGSNNFPRCYATLCNSFRDLLNPPL